MKGRSCFSPASLASLVLGAAIAVSRSALAAPQDAEGSSAGSPMATELFNAGRELMEQGRHAEACPKLAESARLEARVGTLGNLADCEEKLGHVAKARGYWQQAANLARSSGDERAAHAEQQLSRLDAVVPRLKIAMPSAVPAGLVVRVDTIEVGIATLGTPMPLDPGIHAVEASAPGRTPWKADVRLPATGGVVDLAIADLPVVADAGAPTKAAGDATSVLVETGPSPLALVGLAAAGVGVVGLGFGTYFAGVAQSRTDLSNELGCVESRCPEHAAEIRDEARAAGTTATVFLLAGGALAAGGLVTWLLAPDEVEPVSITTAGRPLPGALPRARAPRFGAVVLPEPLRGGAVGTATLRASF